jgi:hypothetical protein
LYSEGSKQWKQVYEGEKMSYILLVVLTVYKPLPNNFIVTEFQTKQACEIALRESKRFYKTVDSESRCISVEDEVRKEKLKNELKKLED